MRTCNKRLEGQNQRDALCKNKQDDFNTIASQCKRIIKRLRQEACTTVELRHEEDVLGVAPRIYDLRHKHGYNIQTFWTYDHNPGGGSHRVAKYVLQPGTWKGGNTDE